MLNKLFENAMKSGEKKSWQPKEYIVYEIYTQLKRQGISPSVSLWFNKEIQQQTDDCPYGIKESDALKLAGKNGTVYKKTIKRERIK